MYGKLKSALLAAMFMGLGGACAMGGDLAGGTTTITNQSDGASGVYYIYNSDTTDDTITNDNSSVPVVGIGTAAFNGTEYVFGASDKVGGVYTQSEGKVNATLGTLELRTNYLTLVNSEKLGSEGTSLTMGNLDASRGGTITLADSAAATAGRYNILTTNNFTTTGIGNTITSVNIGANSMMVVNNHATLGSVTGNDTVDFALGNGYDKGYLKFTNGATLVKGSITGNGDITGNVTLSGNDAGAITAIIDASGSDQVYHGNLAIGANGGQITVGFPGVIRESNLEVTGTLSVNGSQANSLVAIGGTGTTTAGTLTVNDLALSAGGTVNVNQYGNLIVGKKGSTITSTIANGYVNVGTDGEALFNNNIALGGTSAITADGGKVTFANDLTMTTGASLNLKNGGTIDISKVSIINDGKITVFGLDNEVVVGNGLTLNSTNAITFDGNLPSKLVLTKTENGAVGDLNIAKGGAIDFGTGTSGASTLEVGNLTILGTATGNLYNGSFPASPGATIDALSFTVAKGADVKSRNDVTTMVSRTARIMGKYATAGAEYFFRGLQVNNGGELAADLTGAQGGDAHIYVGEAGVRAANVIVNNGTLSSAGGNTLFLENSNLTHESDLVFSGKGNVVKGHVVATGGGGFGIHVDGDVNLEKNGTVLQGDSYSQTGGTFQAYDGKFQTLDIIGTDVSTVTGSKSVFAANANFDKGVAFTNGATLRASDTQTLKLKGDGLAGTNLSMATGTTLDLTNGDIEMTGFDNVYLGSKIRLGFVGAQTTMANTIGSYRTVGNLRNIELSKDFVRGYDYSIAGINDYIWYDNTMTSTPAYDAYTIKNVFGDFGFESLEGDGAWLASVNAKDVADVAGVRQSLGYHWGTKAVSSDFAYNVSQVAQNIMNPAVGASVYPAGNAAGELNYSILEAFALGGPGTSYSSGNTYGNIDRGLLNLYTGAAATGVVFTAQDVTREIINTLHARVADVRSAQNAVASSILASDGALASMSVADALNNQYLNRVWAGGLGMWNNADARKGHTGYKYDGSGLVLGYDRAFGSVIGGLSAAYMKGDYEDKSATQHDSEIKNYALDAYLTYNACSGFFATVMGGWNYSDNDIRERRGGNWAEEDYHTNTWHVGGKVGYDFAPSDRLTLSPAVGANFYYSRSNEHDVLLNGVNTMKYGDMKNHNVELPVEVRAAYSIPLADDQDVTLMANGGYAYNLNDHGVNGDVSLKGLTGVEPMRAVGRKLGHHAWTAGAGAKYRSGGWDVGVKYDYYGRGKSDNHRVMGTVGYSF